MSYALTGGSAAREAELQKTLQQLLERYNGSLMPNSIGGVSGTFLLCVSFARILLHTYLLISLETLFYNIFYQ